MNDQSFAAHDPLLALGDALLSPREAVTLEPILVIRVQGVELALNIVSDRRRAVKYMRRFLSEWSGHAPLTVDDRTALDPREWRFHRRDQAFLDELFLQLPMVSLCKPDCKGLCPVCGIDLNRFRCNCAEKTRNSAFDALKALSFEDKEV